jgi:hypothetical protein
VTKVAAEMRAKINQKMTHNLIPKTQTKSPNKITLRSQMIVLQKT